MEYRNLGKSGLKVSELSLGTLTFGVNADEAMSKRIIDMALDAGINFIDCADAYGAGVSEEIVGRALKGKRDNLIIASKCFNPMGPGPNDGGLSRIHIIQSVENSLKRMQMDYLDIFYLHHVDDETPLEEMLRALDDLVHQGKIRYTACSNFESWRLLEAIWISDSNRWNNFICFQPHYNLVTRDIEHDIIPICQLKGLGVVPYSPLANGFLTGKYKPGKREVSGSRSAQGWNFYKDYWASNADESLQVLLDVAEELGRSPAQVALRWAAEQPAISSVIIGARNTEQALDNLRAGSWKLPAEALVRLNEVSEQPKRYPYNIEPFFADRRKNSIKMPSLADIK